MNNDRIFDLGFHNGDDTDYYLQKGFSVVSVEANPRLVKAGEQRFAGAIESGRLILMNKAISDQNGDLEFYVHPTNSDWSSCFPEIAGSDGSTPIPVKVQGVSVLKLYEQFGVPCYMKVDVEGADSFVAKQVLEYAEKPQFISFETSRRDYAAIFSCLYLAGYKKYQLVNQANNQSRVIETSTVSGEYLSYSFSKYSSGPFGTDLCNEKWLSFDDALTRYMKYKELKQMDNKELGLGWVDIHACFEE